MEENFPTVIDLYNGYSYMKDGSMYANCSCTLVKGSKNIIIDTMTAWDKERIIKALWEKGGLKVEDINFAIATHGHSDHLGNLNLFTNATHIVGFAISKKDQYYIHPFESGEPYIITKHIKVLPTPGHTEEDVSVIITAKEGIVVASGDIFEKLEDIKDPTIWKIDAGSSIPEKQEKNRRKIIEIADFIIPGHGPRFKVTSEMRQTMLAAEPM